MAAEEPTAGANRRPPLPTRSKSGSTNWTRGARRHSTRPRPRPSSGSTHEASSPPANASSSSSTRARFTSSTCSPATAPTGSGSRTTARYRRRGHRLGHGRRSQDLSLRAGLHDVRWRARRGVRREDPQGDGPCRESPARRSSASTTVPARGSRRASSRSRVTAEIFHRNVQCVRRHPADQRGARAVRRRRRLLTGDDRLHLHGEGHVAHVHHRSGRREGGDRRGGHAGGARWRDDRTRTKSGVANFVFDDEATCLEQVRYLLSFLPSNNLEDAPYFEPDDDGRSRRATASWTSSRTRPTSRTT